MKHTQLVDLPLKRISFKNGTKGTKYVYYTIRSYRNKQGKPTSDEKSIGKLDVASGKLIPNRNYFELFPTQRMDYPEHIQSTGYLHVFRTIAERLGITSHLNNIFNEQSDLIINLAAYMVAHGNIMMDYNDWVQETTSSSLEELSSQRISEFFCSLKKSKRSLFFQEWVKNIPENEYIAYDVTSISSYSQDISLVERGYNRDKENLSQLNLGMFYGETSGLPLYYSIYSGSLIDKTYLPFMMSLAEKLGMTKTRFVMDQGFLTKNNLLELQKLGFTCLSLLPKNYRLYIDKLDEVVENPFSVRERLAEKGLYVRTFQVDYESVPVKIYVYYDPEKAVLDEKAMFDEIERQERELQQISRKKSIRANWTKYFTVESMGQEEMTYTLDYDKVDRMKQRLGYFALISTDLNLSAEQAITIYRQKDVIEKSFDQCKNGMDYKRMRTHYTQTTEGKIFVAFIGLIIRSWLMKRIKEREELKKMTLKKVIRELEKIRQIQLKDRTIQTVPLTKLQKQILHVLEIDDKF